MDNVDMLDKQTPTDGDRMDIALPLVRVGLYGQPMNLSTQIDNITVNCAIGHDRSLSTTIR